MPVAWLLINATKTQPNLFNSFGFWFAAPFELFKTLSLLARNVDGEGVFIHWFENTVLYAVAGGVGATVCSVLAGYGFAHYRFRGSGALFMVVLASLLVPATAISLPLFFVFAKARLVNTVWGMILPSIVTVVGVYLMRIYAEAAIPRELLEAARVDGATEMRIFRQISVPLLLPGAMTVLLLSVVGVWNNYFLPLLIFSNPSLYPVTVGLGFWTSHAGVSGNQLLYPLAVVGSLVTMLPLIILFLGVQRYWRGGALVGSMTG